MDEWDQVRQRIKEVQENFHISGIHSGISFESSPAKTTVSDFWKKRYDEEKQAWQEKLTAKEKEQSRTQQKLVQNEEEIRRLAQQIQELEKQLETSSNANSKLSGVEREFEKTKMDWSRKIQALQKDNEALKSGMDRESESARREASEHQKAESENLRLSVELKSFNEKIAALQGDAEKKFQNIKDEKKVLEGQLEELRKQKNGSQEKSQQIEQELGSLQIQAQSQLKRLEDRSKEQLVMFEDLVLGFSHKAQNHLLMISGALQSCMDHPQIEPHTIDQLSLVDQAAGETYQFIEQFLSLVSIPEISMERISLKDLLDQVCAEFENNEQGHGVQIEKHYSEPLWVQADRPLLFEALREVLRNALEASEAGKKVTIQISPAEDPGFLEIRLENEGQPVPEDHLKKIFQPYFTTKKGRKGLGLTLAKRALDFHSGSLWVQNTSDGKIAALLQIPSIQ